VESVLAAEPLPSSYSPRTPELSVTLFRSSNN
jgi:hypothetical protein